MKQRPGIVIAAVRLIFVLSLCVLLYSVLQIVKAPAEASQALEDWDKKREEAQAPAIQAEDETPLPPGMVTLPVQTKSTPAKYADGELIGEIYFPALDRRVAILEGTERAQLKKAPGIMQEAQRSVQTATAYLPGTGIPCSAESAGSRSMT